jgi:serine/threonine-protein kinase SRPK3
MVTGDFLFEPRKG